MSTFLALALSAVLLRQHFLNYTQAATQRYVVRVILIVPIYVVYSLMAMIFYSAAVYIAILRDLYEAYVLWQFFRLMIELGGGQEELLEKVRGVEPFSLPWPFCRKRISLTGSLFFHTPFHFDHLTIFNKSGR